MLQLFIAALLALGTVTAQAQSLSSRSLTAPATRDIGFISQDFVLDGTTNTEFSVAPLTVSNQGFGTRKLAVKLPVAPIRMPLPMPLSNPMAQSDVLREAGYWVAGEYTPMKDRIAGWLRSRGISQAYYTYSQEVMVSTANGPRKKEITFMASIDSAGRSLHGTPKLTDPDPTIVEAMYTPLAVADGLPEDWKFPNAGTLRWRLLNRRFVELTGWQTVDVGGAYDNPEEGDPLERVPCLVDQAHKGCGAPTVSMRTLMDAQGSTFGLLSYVRRIEPYYGEDETADEVTPNTVISVDERVWNCAALNHKGSFGMEVALQADQFAVQMATPAYAFQKVAEYGGRSVSPTSSYEVAAPAATFPGLGPEQIMLSPLPDPAHPEENWWRTTDTARMKDVVYMAPLTIKKGSFSGFVTSSDVSVQTVINAGAVKEYLIGTIADNYWGGSYYPYDRSVYFNVNDPEGIQEAAIVELGFDDWLLLSVNGTTIYVGAHGGNTLESSGMGTVEQTCSQLAANSWQCYKYQQVEVGDGSSTIQVPSGRWEWCLQQGVGDSWDGSMSCGNGCYPGYVQFLKGAIGYGPGCAPLDQAVDWRFSPYIDIRPYLKVGQNHIFARTFVGGKGEMWYRLRVRGCE